jgi:ubiquinone/menaquinone biosynthesis C-methylase UbiE
MSDRIDLVRAHYAAAGLTERIKAALADIAPDDHRLTVEQLAPLDQFHTRGMMATAELAGAANLDASSRVLDLGCGIGGPARYLAATFSCKVTGVDLSPNFIDAARYLTKRCELDHLVTFETGEALHLPFEAASFDTVFLQHVAMNIENRTALYAEIHRVLTQDGRFATYDIVLRAGDVVYPVPWAQDASTSFLLTEIATRSALENAGFKASRWQDDTQTALDWFKASAGAPPKSSLNLSLVMGDDFPAKTGNLARNIRENRLGVLSAILAAHG